MPPTEILRLVFRSYLAGYKHAMIHGFIIHPSYKWKAVDFARMKFGVWLRFHEPSLYLLWDSLGLEWSTSVLDEFIMELNK